MNQDKDTLTFTTVTGNVTHNLLTHGVAGAIVGTSDTQTLTNKTISGSSNTLSNIADASLSTGINANKIASGTVSNTVFGYLANLSSDAQTQITAKLSNVLTTTGDLIYSSSGTTASRLGVGSSGQYLTVSGGLPAWVTINLLGTTYKQASNAQVTVLSTDGTNFVMYFLDFGTNTGHYFIDAKITMNSDHTQPKYYVYQSIVRNNAGTLTNTILQQNRYVSADFNVNVNGDRLEFRTDALGADKVYFIDIVVTSLAGNVSMNS